MPLEIEAKIKVDSHDAVRARLVELSADRVGRVLEANYIFDNAERTLLAGGCGLRIRVCCPVDGNTPPPTLTYKGPRRPGPLKKRQEAEISFDDPAAGRAILESLGFVQVVLYEKRRESWQVGDCQVELDEVPYLGCYVEIEGPNEQSIRRVQESLGLGAKKTIRRSYIALLVKHCEKNGLSAECITFDQAGG